MNTLSKYTYMRTDPHVQLSVYVYLLMPLLWTLLQIFTLIFMSNEVDIFPYQKKKKKFPQYFESIMYVYKGRLRLSEYNINTINI